MQIRKKGTQIKMKQKALVISVSILLIAAKPVFAGFFVATSGGNSNIETNPSHSPESGIQKIKKTPTGLDSNVNSFGQGVPLKGAVAQVVPQGWTVLVSDSLKEKMVSWEKPQTVLQTLQHFAKSTDGKLRVNKAAKTLSILNEFDALPHNKWLIKPGADLESLLTLWGERADWEVSWEILDEKIQLTNKKSYILEANNIKRAVEMLFSSTGLQQDGVYHRAYSGNKMLRIYKK
jgi:hypothetical protein